MKNKTNYGKIIAITLSIITCASAIAFVIYRLLRNLVEFCNTYQLPEEADLEELDFCELEEDEPAEEIVIECGEADEEDTIPAE
ncbi:MAG: hypothetical protein J6U87_02730 [Clostridia bacterium]|nr:hypothetical protein [Clostridia bacterium]